MGALHDSGFRQTHRSIGNNRATSFGIEEIIELLALAGERAGRHSLTGNGVGNFGKISAGGVGGWSGCGGWGGCVSGAGSSA